MLYIPLWMGLSIMYTAVIESVSSCSIWPKTTGQNKKNRSVEHIQTATPEAYINLH